MIRCTVETTWVLVGDTYTADVVRRYPGEWTDISGQPDAQISTHLDGAIFAGVVDAAVFAEIAADPALTVIHSEG